MEGQRDLPLALNLAFLDCGRMRKYFVAVHYTHLYHRVFKERAEEAQRGRQKYFRLQCEL